MKDYEAKRSRQNNVSGQIRNICVNAVSLRNCRTVNILAYATRPHPKYICVCPQPRPKNICTGYESTSEICACATRRHPMCICICYAAACKIYLHTLRGRIRSRLVYATAAPDIDVHMLTSASEVYVYLLRSRMRHTFVDATAASAAAYLQMLWAASEVYLYTYATCPHPKHTCICYAPAYGINLLCPYPECVYAAHLHVIYTCICYAAASET